MPSVRDGILGALVTALNAMGTPATAERFRVLPVDETVLPRYSVTPVEESVEIVGHHMGDLMKRFLVVTIECWAKNGTTPDQQLDPLINWAVQKIMADETLGGRCAYVEELGTSWAISLSDELYSKAEVRLRVWYHTRRTDPTNAGG